MYLGIYYTMICISRIINKRGKKALLTALKILYNSIQLITFSYYKSLTVNKQKSVYEGYISMYVPSIDIIIMCTIIFHTCVGASVL